MSAKIPVHVCEYHCRCLWRGVVDWWGDIFTRKFLVGAVFVFAFLFSLYKLATEDQQVTDQIVQDIATLIAWAGMIAAWLVWKIVSAPYRMEADMIAEHAKAIGGLSDRLSKIEADQAATNAKLDRRQGLIKCGEGLLKLMEEGRSARESKTTNWPAWHSDWRERVRAVLKLYYPEAVASFSAVQTRFRPDSHRDILIEEMRKIDGGILVDLRNMG